jgi:hypothetical protein
MVRRGPGPGREALAVPGHLRATSVGLCGADAVTGGQVAAQVSRYMGVDWSDSQADSAGSISRHPFRSETARQSRDHDGHVQSQESSWCSRARCHHC